MLQVYAARPLYLQLQTTSCAGSRLLRRLEALLLNFGRYSSPPALSAASGTPPRPPLGPVPAEILTPSVLADILHRGLFVADPILDSQQQNERSSEGMQVDLAEEYDEAQDVRLMQALYQRYKANVTATTVSLLVASPASTQASQTSMKGTLVIPGWVRERAADVLFEPGDEDEPSLIQAVLLALFRVSLY